MEMGWGGTPLDDPGVSGVWKTLTGFRRVPGEGRRRSLRRGTVTFKTNPEGPT